jgi:predicted O-methyltransferase YrrM
METNEVISMRGDVGIDSLVMMCNELKLEGKIMAEIGSYAGESTEVFAEFCKVVYAIDPWLIGMSLSDGTANDFHLIMGPDVEKVFDKRMADYTNVIKMKMFDTKALRKIKNGTLDFVYIDALHTYDECRTQIHTWSKKLKKGGVIAGHDFSEQFPGIVKAVIEELGIPTKIYPDSSWYFIY